jgi:hypothetical protein
MIRTEHRPSGLRGLRDQIRGRWHDLSDEDIERASGSLDRLIERIHKRTGEPRPSIRRELRRILTE